MLDGNSFVSAGWVHDFLLHTLQLSEPNTVRYLIKGKVNEIFMSLLRKMLYAKVKHSQNISNTSSPVGCY